MLQPLTRLLQPLTRLLQPLTRLLQPLTRLLQPLTRLLQPITCLLQPITRLLQTPEIDNQKSLQSLILLTKEEKKRKKGIDKQKAHFKKGTILFLLFIDKV